MPFPSHVLHALHALLATATAAVLLAPGPSAAMGFAELPANATSGPVTVFYPSTAPEAPVARRGFRFNAAPDAPASGGNRRLVVISHGSPGNPWVHGQLTRALVDAGFTVALPEHEGDNSLSHGDSGAVSWKRRPLEVSRAIDRLLQEPRWAASLDAGKVGMFGMSAGGHTALTLAGGRWSPSRLLAHCEKNLDDDFHTCAGPSFAPGGPLAGVKKAVVRVVLGAKLADTASYGHVDPRITAIVAGVPFAADFDPDSLRNPAATLGIVSARADRWLVPRFHSDFVLAQCAPRCVALLDLPTGGHGALIGPLPPDLSGDVGALVADPPGFAREAEVARVNGAVTGFFQRQLGAPR